MFGVFDRRAKSAPAQYPRILFHGIRLFQLIASIIVGGIMLYFMYYLNHDHLPTPWTFIWLTAASLTSILALFVTMILHCIIGLHPRLNLFVNGFLAILWALSWSLLTWFMSGTLINQCDVEHWNEDVGIMVCRIYKALFTFTLLGMLMTFSALILDFYVHRQVSRRGIYRLHDVDAKPRPEATRGPFTDTVHMDEMDDSRRVSEAWEAPRESMGPYSERAERVERPKNGYTVPEHQFEYDTEYRGHAGPEGKFYDEPERR